MNRKFVFKFAALLMFVFSSGCGGGGGTGTSNLQQQTAEVTFGTASSDQTVQIKGIFLVTTLPAGVSVATEPGSNQISTAALKGVGNGGQVFGTYSAAIRKVKIGSFTSSTIALGPYARLTCNVLPGVTLQESAFTLITPIDFQPTGQGGISLTNVLPTTAVTFGY